MSQSSTPIFDAIKEEQGVDDAVFLPFKSHEEFLAEHEHDVWLNLVLTMFDDQQVHRPTKAVQTLNDAEPVTEGEEIAAE